MKTENNDIEFLKQVPVHPRERLRKKIKEEKDIEFLKQVPVHPRDRLRRKSI